MTEVRPAVERSGEVFDLGYRGYEGRREGVWRARRAIWRDAARTSVGLGRSLAQKILPFVIIGLNVAFPLVLLVLLGLASTFGDEAEPLENTLNKEYFEFSFFPLLLFAASLGPELLCPDRRQGLLTLYLVRPLRVRDYVAAKWAGFFTVMLLILVIPQILLLAARALNASEPFDFLRDHAEEIPQLLASSVVFAAFFTSLALAVSSFTDRRHYAAAGVLGTVVIAGAVGGIGAEVLTGTGADLMELANIGGTLIGVNDWIFGDYTRGVAASVNAAALAVVLAGLTLLLFQRYRGIHA